MTCVWVGVWTTCNGRDQDEHVRAYARSRVYRSGKALRDIKGARGDQGTADGVLCVSAEGSGLNFTCKMRTAWASSSGLRQEEFQAFSRDLDAS